MKDIYIEFRGKYKVDGESRDSEHKGWLEVNSWSHNIRQPKSATSSSVGGHTAERVEHSDMVFVKDLDATSPKLWEACSAGYTFDEVMLKKGKESKPDRLDKIWEQHQGVKRINVFDDLDDALEEYKEMQRLYARWRPDLEFNIYRVTPSGVQLEVS